jgi:hypothetical protein
MDSQSESSDVRVLQKRPSPLRAGVDAVASAFRPRPMLVHDANESFTL